MRLFIAIFFLFYTQFVLALDLELSLKLGEAESTLTSIEKVLQLKNSNDVENLQEFHTKSLNIQLLANQCIDENEQSINKSADDLDLLGPQNVPEDSVITEKRVSLNKNMLSSAQQLATCRLMLLRTNEAISSSLVQQQALIESRLFTQQSTILDHIQFNLLNPLTLISETQDFIHSQVDFNRLYDQKFKLLGVIVLSILLTFLVKKWLKSVLKKKTYNQQPSLGGQILFSVLSCTNHYIAILLTSFSIAVFTILTSDLSQLSFVSAFFVALSFLTLLIWAIRVFLNPCLPAKSFLTVETSFGLLLSKRLQFLAWLLFIGFLLFIAFNIYQFSAETQGLMRNVFVAFVVLNLIWITFILGEFNSLANTLFIRMLLVLALVVSLISDWSGYSNLSLFILIGLTASVFLLLLALFISRLFSDFIDGFDEGRYQWQKKARKYIGVKTDGYIPGAIWFRLSGNILIWTLGIVLALKAWGLSDSSLLELKGVILDGFKIGSIEIIPTKVFISLLSLSIMISFVGWIKRRLDKSWLNRSRMDRGTKEAVISLTGYFGMAIVFLITLSIAGFQLANLAIVAGALSVGIGFGLQNIVNNFVSGVILLFERPIKTGDWVSVGSTEGYVRKISIRSTQIQTFDRSDVLVPNSELISGQVTNWMLKDSRGRLVVPVGVAYGTDAEKVKTILEGIAYSHDQVIKNSPILPDPYVLFREFADSSLNFELRCFLINVDTRLRVLSDINFEINRLFNQHNIEIPFPQRDLNIKHAELPTIEPNQ